MFRRSGSVTCFVVEGSLPSTRSEDFVAALERERFQSIETAATEQTSIGWVTPGDPTGGTFDIDEIETEAACWLRVRIDKKALPRPWVEIHRSVAQKNRGRPLGRKELRELREELERDLLPKVLPTVKLIDVLYLASKRRVLVFGTGAGLRDTFGKLFRSTFEVGLTVMDPVVLAGELPLSRDEQGYLEQVAPVRWPREGAGEARPTVAGAAAGAAPGSREAEQGSAEMEVEVGGLNGAGGDA